MAMKPPRPNITQPFIFTAAVQGMVGMAAHAAIDSMVKRTYATAATSPSLHRVAMNQIAALIQEDDAVRLEYYEEACKLIDRSWGTPEKFRMEAKLLLWINNYQ